MLNVPQIVAKCKFNTSAIMMDSPRICLERCDEDIDLLSQLIEDSNANATSEDRFDMSDEMLSSDIDDLTSYLCKSSKREFLDDFSKPDDSCMPPPAGNEMSPASSGPSHSPLHNSEVIMEKVDQKIVVDLSGTPSLGKSSKPVSIVYLPKSQPCMTKNAVTARENRIKKKKYVQQLESDVHSLKEENSQLKTRISSQDGKIVKLNEQLQYLKSVIANQTTLSALLQNIQNTAEVKLKSSWSLKPTECNSEKTLTCSTSTCSNQKNREQSEENQENSSRHKSKRKFVFESENLNPAKSLKAENMEDSLKSNAVCGNSESFIGEQNGGVCLHVSGKEVSLEFCAACSKMAASSRVLDDHSYVRSSLTS